MNTSDKTEALTAALIKAQGEFPAITKNKTAGMGQYSYDYADLHNILDSVSGPLHQNGLSFAHGGVIRDGVFVLSCRLMHTSGQWLESEVPIAMGIRPQEMGAAITYARRYTLSGLLGVVADEDTDAEGVHGSGSARPAKPNYKAPTQSSLPHPSEQAPIPMTRVQPTRAIPTQNQQAPVNRQYAGPSEKQMIRLYAIAKNHHWTMPEVEEISMRLYKTKSKTLASHQYQDLCSLIESMDYVNAMQSVVMKEDEPGSFG